MPKETRDEQIVVQEVDINILIKFINKFDGNRDKLNSFLNNCSNAIKLASPNQQDILLKYIISQLEGRAEVACSIKDFDSWQQLEDFLKAQFGNKKHYAALLSDLQGCRQLNGETVNQFALKIESCLSKLLTEINISIPTRKKGELAGRVAAMQDLALHTFVIGLNPRLSTVVRCRDPETLNDAINFAVSEEKIYLASLGRNANFPSNNSNHTRFRQPQIKTPITQNRSYNNYNMPTFPPRPVNPIVCRYCKFPGHSIEACRKRQYNNSKFKNNNYQPNLPSVPSRNQPIHAISSPEDYGVDEGDASLNE